MQPWMRPCREELLALDPRYVVLFDIRWQYFNGECTAVDLHRQIHQRSYKWAPSERWVRRWLNEIIPVETRHKLHKRNCTSDIRNYSSDSPP